MEVLALKLAPTAVRPPPRVTSYSGVGWMIAALVAAAGIYVRVRPWAGFNGQGFDEALYAHYLRQLIAVGLGGYPDIVDSYVAYQKTIPGSILPPTRFLYIFCAYGWHGLFGANRWRPFMRFPGCSAC